MAEDWNHVVKFLRKHERSDHESIPDFAKGWVVLTRGRDEQWDVDWDGVLHLNHGDAEAAAAEARRSGWRDGHVAIVISEDIPEDAS